MMLDHLSTLGPLLLFWLFVSILIIIYLSAKVKLHPFLAIIISTYLFGLGVNAIGKILGIKKVVSHVNDSYFWVVTQFSGMNLTTAYRAQTVATLIQGIVGIIVTFILGLIFL
jgi:H+/gluconate symporter-like permease